MVVALSRFSSPFFLPVLLRQPRKDASFLPSAKMRGCREKLEGRNVPAAMSLPKGNRKWKLNPLPDTFTALPSASPKGVTPSSVQQASPLVTTPESVTFTTRWRMSRPSGVLQRTTSPLLRDPAGCTITVSPSLIKGAMLAPPATKAREFPFPSTSSAIPQKSSLPIWYMSYLKKYRPSCQRAPWRAGRGGAHHTAVRRLLFGK
jgi:hypothetical protein